MQKNLKKISAVIILAVLICVPFWDWKLGSLLWMCAWLVYIFQNMYFRRNWDFDDETGEEESEEEEPPDHCR